MKNQILKKAGSLAVAFLTRFKRLKPRTRKDWQLQYAYAANAWVNWP